MLIPKLIGIGDGRYLDVFSLETLSYDPNILLKTLFMRLKTVGLFCCMIACRETTTIKQFQGAKLIGMGILGEHFWNLEQKKM